MIPSGALEIHFSLLAEPLATKKPFYFHHTPKAAGTSLRQSVREFLEVRGAAGTTVVTDFKSRCVTTGQWPGALYVVHDQARQGARLNAVMSHYTALLAQRIDDPIVAIVREPEDQFRSAVAFFQRRMGQLVRKRGSAEAVLTAEKVNNVQVRSLSGVNVPMFAPTSARRVERWIKLVDRILDRFTLFPLAGYGSALSYIEEEYGMKLRENRVKRGKPATTEEQDLVDLVLAESRRQDPVWLDRILYKRVLDNAERRERTVVVSNDEMSGATPA